MVAFTKVNGSVNKDMDLEFNSGRKEQNTKVIGNVISSTAMAHSVFPTVIYIKENGSPVKHRAMEFYKRKMAIYFQALGLTTNGTAKAR